MSLAAASIAMTFLEPDPDQEWDQQRLASLQDLLGVDLDRSTAIDQPADQLSGGWIGGVGHPRRLGERRHRRQRLPATRLQARQANALPRLAAG